MRYTSKIALITILALSAQTVSAAASKEENVGIGTGAAIGILAGGPVGLVIGVALGAKIGDILHNKSEEIETLEGSLQSSRDSVFVLERDMNKLNNEIDYLQSITEPELVSLMQAGIDMDLLFRTDEFALTNLSGDRLKKMANTLAAMSSVKIQLDGFADERGDSEYNLELSEKRVEFVRNIFITAGVHSTRIGSLAHGESTAQHPDADSYALERKVSVKLFIDNTQSLAANTH